MEASLPVVVGWLFVFIFGVVAGLMLLDLAGLRRIADEEHRKWLFRSLIAAVVVAVAGLGTAYLKKLEANSPAVQPTPSSTPVSAPTSPIARASPTSLPPDPKGPAVSSPPAAPATQTRSAAIPGQCPADAAVASWASANLGERPRIPPEFDSEYPACVTQLRGANASTNDDAVSSCVNALAQHHQRFVLGFYRTKEAYDVALKKWERDLRRTGIEEGERDRYNYVVCENEDLNDPGGPTLEARDSAEQRLSQDGKACRRNRCRPL